MKFRIHFTTPGLGDGDPGEDSIVIEGDSIEELRKQAAVEVAKRSGTNPWSEEITGDEYGKHNIFKS